MDDCKPLVRGMDAAAVGLVCNGMQGRVVSRDGENLMARPQGRGIIKMSLRGGVSD